MMPKSIRLIRDSSDSLSIGMLEQIIGTVNSEVNKEELANHHLPCDACHCDKLQGMVRFTYLRVFQILPQEVDSNILEMQDTSIDKSSGMSSKTLALW